MNAAAAHPDLSAWVLQLELEARGAQNLTLGIANGDRHPIDRRVLDQLARSLTGGANGGLPQGKLLIVRLRDESETPSVGRRSVAYGQVSLSPLGSWYVVDLQQDTRGNQGDAAKRVAAELPQWKQQYRLILIDLGSLGGSTSRELGYFCDGSYIVLGPESCAAPEWLRLQIGRHDQAGSQVCGTITVAAKQAA